MAKNNKVPWGSYSKSNACRCQRSVAVAFRNSLGMFDYTTSNKYYLNTFKWQYHYYVGGSVQDDPFQKDNMSHFLKGLVKTFDLIPNMAINIG